MYGPESEARAFPLQHKPGLESICHLLTEEQKQPAPSVSCGSNLNVIWYIYYSDWSSGLCVANRRTWFAGGNCHVRGPRHYEGLWWRFIWVGFFHWTCLLFTCENIPYMAGLTIDSLTYTGVRTVLNCAVKPDKHGMCKARHNLPNYGMCTPSFQSIQICFTNFLVKFVVFSSEDWFYIS